MVDVIYEEAEQCTASKACVWMAQVFADGEHQLLEQQQSFERTRRVDEVTPELTISRTTSSDPQIVSCSVVVRKNLPISCSVSGLSPIFSAMNRRKNVPMIYS